MADKWFEEHVDKACEEFSCRAISEAMISFPAPGLDKPRYKGGIARIIVEEFPLMEYTKEELNEMWGVNKKK